MSLEKYINDNGVSSDYIIFNEQTMIKKRIAINDIFFAQYFKENFIGYDIVITLLAIENFYNLNTNGFDLYNRIFPNKLNELLNFLNSDKIRNNKINIETDLKLSLHNNINYLALCIFNKIKYVDIDIYNIDLDRKYYDIELLKKYYDKKQLNIIENKLADVLEELNKPYYMILWPPAYNIFDKIEKEIELVEDGIKILYSDLFTLTFSEFKDFLYEIYKNDDIEKYKIDKKYNGIINSCVKSGISLDKMCIKILKVLLLYPDYKIKVFNGNPRSKTTMRIKKKIRDDNKDFIVDYYYDNIIHTTDNIHQNIQVDKIIKKLTYKKNVIK